MLTPAYYHVTERSDAMLILEEGFQGGWGDVGFGVYTYASYAEAVKYAAKGGWDSRLKDPVILRLEDDGLEQVEPHGSWKAATYEQMYWKELDEDDEDAFWMPQSLTLLEMPDQVPDAADEPPPSVARARRRP